MAKILFITTRLPYPANEGHQIRTYNLLKRICQQHEVHYLSLQRNDDSELAVEHLQSLCASVASFNIPNEHSKLRFLYDLGLGFISNTPFVVRKYYSKQLAKAIQSKLAQQDFDLVHFDMLPLAQYADVIGDIPFVLNNHNVESLLLKRRAENASSFIEKLFFNNQSKSLHNFETQACQHATETYVCSQTDADVLANMATTSKLTVVENGVDTKFFPAEKIAHTPNSLVWVGGMGWFPNKDGMRFFLNEVMPSLVAKCPDIQLTMVGKSTGVDIPDSVKKHVTVTGFVDDFRPIVNAAQVYILPIRVGSGTRLKLLEAMSMGKAIVSTTIGAEGVQLAQNENIMYANSSQEFIDTILALFDHSEKIATLGDNARTVAEQCYDWDIIAAKLLNSYEEIVN